MYLYLANVCHRTPHKTSVLFWIKGKEGFSEEVIVELRFKKNKLPCKKPEKEYPKCWEYQVTMFWGGKEFGLLKEQKKGQNG